jgi:hypothetical protein
VGSFNATCIVSGLPIQGGDKVRFLVLARSALHPDGNDHPHYVNGNPRAPGGGPSWEPAAGIPTFKRVKEALVLAGQPIQSRDQEDPYVLGWTVDDTSPGFVRVRSGGYGNDLDPTSVLPVLHAAGYAAMVVAGSGSYAKDSEVLVGPLPPADPGANLLVRPYGSDEEVPHTFAVRPASQALIREDVWQLLLSLPGWADRSVGEMKEDAVRAFEEDLREAAGGENEERALRKLRMFLDCDGDRGNNFFRDVIRDSITGTVGFGLHDAFEASKDPGLDPEKARQFVQEIAETAFAQFAYSSLHGQWQPRSGGGQDPNWGGFHGYLLKLVEIVRKRHGEDAFREEEDLPEPEDQGDYDESETLE